MKEEKAPDHVYVYGRHVLIEALRHMPMALEEVYIEKASDDGELLRLLKNSTVKVSFIEGTRFPKDVQESAVHQGVIAKVSLAVLVRPYKPFIEGLAVTPDTSLLILGEVQDPQNVGAVIRSAAAFGVAGVLIPPHNQAQVTGAVIKVSAGMAFRIPIVAIGNVNTVARELKDRGFWLYGLDGTAEGVLADETFSKPSAFILGNEAEGLRLKTKEVCDILLKVPIHPQCESLNAAAATAVVLYAWSTQHPDALKG